LRIHDIFISFYTIYEIWHNLWKYTFEPTFTGTMKAMKSISVFVLAALTTISSAQLVAYHDGFETTQELRLEQGGMNSGAGWMTGVATAHEHNGTLHRELLEEDIPLEPWMTRPFETEPMDEELVMERWMTEPFEIPRENKNLWSANRMILPNGISLSFNADQLVITSMK